MQHTNKTLHAALTESVQHPRKEWHGAWRMAHGAGSDQEVGITSVSTLVPALFSALTAIDLDWEGGDKPCVLVLARTLK